MIKKKNSKPRQLVECVPNISVGRDKRIIAKIASAIKSVSAVKLLDTSSDPDHNRTVYTFIGPPRAVTAAAYRMCREAFKHLDIRCHAGVHPFIGIVDVLPFVPWKNISRRQIVKLARQFGERIGKDFKVPVYLYGWAASRPVFKNLPQIRRGGLAALSRDIKTSRRPDFGPAKLHPKYGAVAVGARDFLIAFNVNLKSRDLKTALAAAKEIARKIREKDGGLPGIRAIGVPLPSRNLVQVSVNITDHRKTSLQQVFQAIKKLTTKNKIAIDSSEIIGLLPPMMGDNLKKPNYLKLEKPVKIIPV